MSGKDNRRLSRRAAMTSACIAGVGIAANRMAAAALTLKAPTLDLTQPGDALLACARLVGNVAPQARRYDWFDGVMHGIAPDGRAIPLATLRGHVETSLTQHVDGDGWHRDRHIVGAYFDNETNAPLENMLNPFTGEQVTVPAFGVELRDVLDGNELPTWRQHGDQIVLEEAESFTCAGVGATAVTSRVASLRAVHDPALTAVPELGTWMVLSPWPHWLRMDRTPGHCLIQCKRGGGANRRSALPNHHS